MGVTRIISGGQTGVDRAGLDVARRLGVPRGGSCPRGRRAEDGWIPDEYPLTETATDAYEERTERNVLASDGTVLLYYGPRSGGVRLTAELCRTHHKPLYAVDLSVAPRPDRTAFAAWVAAHRIAVLNVAGSRESTRPIYTVAYDYLLEVLGGITWPSV